MRNSKLYESKMRGKKDLSPHYLIKNLFKNLRNTIFTKKKLYL